MIDLSAMACSLQQNGIKQVAYKEPNILFVGYFRFTLEGDIFKTDRDIYYLDDYRSIINILMYLELVDRDIALMTRIKNEYKLMCD